VSKIKGHPHISRLYLYSSMTVKTGVGHPTIYLDVLRDIVVFLQGKQKTLSSQTRQNYPVWYIDKYLDFYGTKNDPRDRVFLVCPRSSNVNEINTICTIKKSFHTIKILHVYFVYVACGAELIYTRSPSVSMCHRQRPCHCHT